MQASASNPVAPPGLESTQHIIHLTECISQQNRVLRDVWKTLSDARIAERAHTIRLSQLEAELHHLRMQHGSRQCGRQAAMGEPRVYAREAAGNGAAQVANQSQSANVPFVWVTLQDFEMQEAENAELRGRLADMADKVAAWQEALGQRDLVIYNLRLSLLKNGIRESNI